eukprot:TRINITY_DN2689_c0_g1_i1.p1 TRINITY_DN2689_c0_g1~~TRINITY_DN2689_c0_g1_i1.p1  ORF type:complete len:559 (-),score=125.95 TRINITY_DN2689_c0_g1_i1:28-1704(-)
MKYVLITGGVLSGIGKGVIASSTAVILKCYGYSVTQIKIDPYLNVDAGTMSPFEHGEVYVLDDGGEVDLDLGNYERFADITLTRDNNITTGKIYKAVIEKERKGEYLGKTVQVIPHITDAIQDWIEKVARVPADGNDTEPDICVIELGGTVGDIEHAPFVEAMRQFQFRVGKENICFVHVSLVPIIGVVGEPKTKPTQSSVRELRAQGLSPDIIACRSTTVLQESIKQKISNFCHVSPSCVISVPDVSNVYQVPGLLHEQTYSDVVLKALCLEPSSEPDFESWYALSAKYDMISLKEESVNIAIVGKYTDLSDAYLSILKSFKHASIYTSEKIEITWIEASDLENADGDNYAESWENLKKADGILVPGGFGDRGIEGMILAAQYARENNIPYLGICLGLQIAVIETARNQLGLSEANSEEFHPEAPHILVKFMPEGSRTVMGATMRLGKRDTIFKETDCKIHGLYEKLWGSQDRVTERHRHRYEVNTEYLQQLEDSGMKFVGHDIDKERMEILELDNHQYFVAVQYHPEFKSRPLRPSPPFVGLILASAGRLESWLSE